MIVPDPLGLRKVILAQGKNFRSKVFGLRQVLAEAKGLAEG